MSRSVQQITHSHNASSTLAPGPSTDGAVPARTGSVRGRTAVLLHRYGMVVLLAILVVAAQALYPGFLTGETASNILSQAAPIGIIAVGMTLVMITGGFDLSVGAVYAAGATFYASFASQGVPLPYAAAATVALGLACGALNALIVARLKVNSFVATLGTASIIGGAAYIYSNSRSYVVSDPVFGELGNGAFLGMPISIWILLVAFAGAQFVLSKTIYGRSIFAIGGNNEAARLAGLRVDVLRASTYVILSGCAAVAGMLMSSRLGVGQADIGATVALDAIAVVVIGGTSLLGGEGAIWRTMIGLLIVGVLGNLLDSLAVDPNGQMLIKGVIVIAAVALDTLAKRKRG